MADDSNIKVLTQQGLPSATLNNVYSSARGTKYGEIVQQAITGSKLVGVADEGSYYTAGLGATASSALRSPRPERTEPTLPSR